MNYLKDHTYPLPSPEDIFSKLDDGKVFSKIDLSDTYLQVKVDEECSKLLTINKGICKLNHPPFVLNVASSLFQQVMDTMLAGLEFTTAYLDEIQLRSENNELCKKHIKAVFQKIDEARFREMQVLHEADKIFGSNN